MCFFMRIQTIYLEPCLSQYAWDTFYQENNKVNNFFIFQAFFQKKIINPTHCMTELTNLEHTVFS